MRPFAKPGGIERLSLEARIVYTGFCLFMLLGYASSAWLYTDDELGTTGVEAARYYLGETDAVTGDASNGGGSGAPAPGGGPELELPAAEGLRFAKPPRQVMETFHFHLLTVPVCLLIIAHLFMMTALSTRAKAWIIGLSTAATLIHVVLPPIVRFGSASFAVLVFPSALAMALGWIAMTVLPVWEMWKPPNGKSRVVD